MRLRRPLISFACLAAVAAMGYGQYLIRLNPDDGRATAIFLAATLVAVLLLGWEGPWPEPTAAQPVKGQRSWLGALLVAAGLAAVAAGSLLLAQNWQVQFYRGWALLVGGTTALSVGCWRFDPARTRAQAWSRAELLMLTAILALGFFLRFYRYTDFPPPYGVHAVEEPQLGMRAYQVLHGIHAWEFLLDNYLGAAGIYLRHDYSLLSIRIPFSIASALTIIPLYLLLRQLVSVPAALAGAFFFSVSSWNIIYSRCAHNIFFTNFIVVIVLALLVRFGLTRRLAVVPWIGLLAGYTLYAYAGYRGTSILALIFLGLLLLKDLRRWWRADRSSRSEEASALRRSVGALAIVIPLIAALAAPVIIITSSNAAQRSYYFEAAIRSLSNKNYYTSDPSAFLRQRLQRVRETARIFMHRGDGSDTFNEPGEPMVDPLTSVCFMGGLLLAAGRPRRRFQGFLLFMFIFLLLGGAVFVQNLDVRRLQGVTPFVAIFAALFLDRLWAFAGRLPAGRVLALALAAVGGVFAVGWNYNVYFNKMAHNRGVREAFLNRYMILVHYGHTIHNRREILLLSDIKYFFTPSDFYWLIEPNMHGRALKDLTELFPPKRLPAAAEPRSVVVQYPYEGRDIARILSGVYPGTTCNDFTEPDNPYIGLTTCDLPDNPTPQRSVRTTLVARYWLGPTPEGPPVVERHEPFIGFTLVPEECYTEHPPTAHVCSAEWTGTLQIETDGEYEFIAEGRDGSTLSVTIDGQPLPHGTLHLAAGVHAIAARAQMPRQGETGVRLLWQTPQGRELVPFYHLDALGAAASDDQVGRAAEPAPTP